MLLAHLLAVAELLIPAIFAHQVLLLHFAFRLHGLAAVLHTAEVGLLALEALVVSTIVHGEALQVIKVDVTLFDNATRPVIALFFCFLCCELADLGLEVQGLLDERRESWHLVASDGDFLLARRAVEVSESDAERGPFVTKQHLHAVGVEDVAAAQSDAGLLSELAREADAAQLALSSALEQWPLWQRRRRLASGSPTHVIRLIRLIRLLCKCRLDAILVEAGQAGGLSGDALASVSALQRLVAHLEIAAAIVVSICLYHDKF